MSTHIIYMEHYIQLKADFGLFKGLANQNMLFHQCLCELIDNSIAAKKTDESFRVDIIFKRKDNQSYDLFFVDNSKGMSFETLTKAIQPGESATHDNRLNEHGFGLKHALATLTKKTGNWKLWTKDLEKGNISSVHSPFKYEMIVEDDDKFPALPYKINNPSTIILAEVTLDFIQSVQGRGKPAESIVKLRQWLIEHLGVIYRGYLSQDPNNNHEVDGSIFVSIEDDKQKVIPIEIPMDSNKYYSFQVEINGKNVNINYNTGLIDETRRKSLFNGQGLKAYYTQSTLTQGIDIRLGKRVISTKQLLNIWGFTPHNKFNDFAAELIIPDLPRGILTTVNNKTDLDFQDPDWIKIFDVLKKDPYIIPENARFAEEEQLRDQWIRQLKATNPKDNIVPNYSVWGAGVKIDVYRGINDDKTIFIYELKTGKSKPIDVYQLKMYWDGLVLEQQSPDEAWLIAELHDKVVEDMIKKINLFTPHQNAKAYNFHLKTLEELNLIKVPKKPGKKN